MMSHYNSIVWSPFLCNCTARFNLLSYANSFQTVVNSYTQISLTFPCTGPGKNAKRVGHSLQLPAILHKVRAQSVN